MKTWEYRYWIIVENGAAGDGTIRYPCRGRMRSSGWGPKGSEQQVREKGGEKKKNLKSWVERSKITT